MADKGIQGITKSSPIIVVHQLPLQADFRDVKISDIV